MNNETISGLSSQAYIYGVYLSFLQFYMEFVCLTILIYASFLHFEDELEYIWKRKFTLPTYLYLLSKYPLFFYFPVVLVSDLWPTATSTLRLCNDLGTLIEAINILPFIGVQGLISVRTYSLCRGYRPMLIALSVTFLVALAFYVYILTLPSCTTVPQGFYYITTSIINISTFISDILAFITVIWQVWGLWRLKRGLGLQSHQDLITSILRQGFLRFSFVLLISMTLLLLGFLSQGVANVLAPIQNILSSICMCEFTLALRRRNTSRSASNPSALDLPGLSFREGPVQSARFVLGQFQKNIMTEMGEIDELAVVSSSPTLSEDDLQEGSHGTEITERNDPLDIDGPSSREPDDLHDMNLGSVEDRGEAPPV